MGFFKVKARYWWELLADGPYSADAVTVYILCGSTLAGQRVDGATGAGAAGGGGGGAAAPALAGRLLAAGGLLGAAGGVCALGMLRVSCRAAFVVDNTARTAAIACRLAVARPSFPGMIGASGMS